LTLEFEVTHEREDLDEKPAGAPPAASKVGEFVSIDTGPVVSRRLRIQDDETNGNGNHTDTAVHELGFTVPGQTIRGAARERLLK
jgi:hypothetical protein